MHVTYFQFHGDIVNPHIKDTFTMMMDVEGSIEKDKKFAKKTLNIWRLFVTPVIGLAINEVVHCDPFTPLSKGYQFFSEFPKSYLKWNELTDCILMQFFMYCSHNTGLITALFVNNSLHRKTHICAVFVSTFFYIRYCRGIPTGPRNSVWETL